MVMEKNTMKIKFLKKKYKSKAATIFSWRLLTETFQILYVPFITKCINCLLKNIFTVS